RCDGARSLSAPPLAPDRFGRRDIIVPAGGSIQAAVNAAGPGAVIQIEPGIYAEAVHVAVPGLKLVGQRTKRGDGVVIVNPGGEENGISVDPGSDGFALVNVTVRGFAENGVFLSGIHGFLLSEVTAQDNGEYGLFPVHSSDGVIERCRASGHDDTGIYVGQDTGVTVRQSVTFANVNGIEFENSHYVRERDALAHGDRNSTRLNSSHERSSYAVFCLQQKTKNQPHHSSTTYHSVYGA